MVIYVTCGMRKTALVFFMLASNIFSKGKILQKLFSEGAHRKKAQNITNFLIENIPRWS